MYRSNLDTVNGETIVKLNKTMVKDMTTKYKTHRFVDGKVRYVIVDKNGNIVNRKPSKEELKDLEEGTCGRVRGNICCICKEIIIGIWYKYPNSKNWDGKSWSCNICYQRNYRKDNPDIVKRHNDKLSMASNWKNGELDPYTTSGKGYIVEQFSCKILEIDNLNVKNNTFRAKYDAIGHKEYGNLQIKGASYNTTYQTWGRTIGESGTGQDFDTLLLVCMDKYMPWKNVERVLAIPEIEVYGKRSVTVYKNPSPSVGSKWDDFMIDEKPFNDVYHNLTIEDCPALRKDKWKEWLRLMKYNKRMTK